MKTAAGPLLVITFNLRHGWAEDGRHIWSARKRAVAALLKRHRPDIIGFQEVNFFQIQFLKDCLPGYHYLADETRHGELWEYRPIFVRPGLTPLAVDTFSLSKTPQRPSKSWGSRFIRQATRVMIETGWGELAVYNAHLDFDSRTRLKQAEVIWRLVRERDLDRPTILMGDFNGRPQGRAYRHLTGGPEQGRGDFKDAMPWPQPFTFHRFTGQPRAGYIDWMLYRGPIRPVGPARVLYESHHGLYPSDHFPVAALFEPHRAD